MEWNCSIKSNSFDMKFNTKNIPSFNSFCNPINQFNRDGRDDDSSFTGNMKFGDNLKEKEINGRDYLFNQSPNIYNINNNYFRRLKHH